MWLFQLLSLGLLGVGLLLLSLAVWLLARPRSSLPLLLLAPLPLPLLLLATLAGLVLLAAAILGLCAAARQARLLTATWQLLLLVLLLAESGRLSLPSLTDCDVCSGDGVVPPAPALHPGHHSGQPRQPPPLPVRDGQGVLQGGQLCSKQGNLHT